MIMAWKDPEKNKAHSKKHYQEHKVEESIKHNQKYRKIKIEVLTHYGGGNFACVICGEARFPCLSIDHINGNGTQHLKQLGIGGGENFYRWLKKNGFPEGYQTLCANCQCAKRETNNENRCSN